MEGQGGFPEAIEAVEAGDDDLSLSMARLNIYEPHSIQLPRHSPTSGPRLRTQSTIHILGANVGNDFSTASGGRLPKGEREPTQYVIKEDARLAVCFHHSSHSWARREDD
ncbi:hypothetical protein N7G274_004590 [Stereocaulon virgatum]|uniref:Uncharacterized protein n=1 Tax=Stereocaulon virgatum TaxID=373712 RepID=A0ABR4AAN0_9LECA